MRRRMWLGEEKKRCEDEKENRRDQNNRRITS
jgi:hypothetical protein